MSKIYEELKRAHQSKVSRESLPLDLLTSVIEKPSSGPPPIVIAETVIQLSPDTEKPPSQEDVAPRKSFSENVIGGGLRTATPGRSASLFFRWALLSIVVVLFLGFGLFRLISKTPQKPFVITSKAEDNSSLGLKSERVGTDWRVSWDRTAPLLQPAIGAHVSISDGATHKEFDLGPGELRNGSLVYSPISDNVLLRFQVMYKDVQQTVSESVRIVAGSIPPFVPVPEHPNGVGSYGHHSVSAPVATVLRPSPIKVATTGSSFSKPNIGVNEVPPVELPTPSKNLGQENPIAAIKPASDNEHLLSDHPAIAPLAITPSVSSDLKVPAVPSHSATAPVSPPPVASGLEPAKLVRGDSPVYPPNARRMNIEGSVEVRFRISVTGKVESVSVVKGLPVLVSSALEAVKEWHYEPARLNGTPVESERDITFQFQPN